MGLLDQILGGMTGGGRGGGLGDVLGGGGAGGGLGGMAGRAGLGGGKGALLMMLLPLVLQMLGNRGAATRSAPEAPEAPGAGGLGGLLERLTQRGFGAQAQSWVSTGPNEPLPASALDGVFDDDQVAALAAQTGASAGEVRAGLAELLPEVVDRLTPAGQVPAQSDLLSSIDDFVARLGPR